jgi:hypothetical protein
MLRACIPNANAWSNIEVRNLKKKVLPPSVCAREEFSHRIWLDAALSEPAGSSPLALPEPTESWEEFLALWCRERGGDFAEAFFRVETQEVFLPLNVDDAKCRS